MNELRAASLTALTHVTILNGQLKNDERSEEMSRLRTMREVGAMKPLAARVTLLTTLGWSRSEIAEAMDVSRVTLNKWLREHTDGEHTFDPYLPGHDPANLDSVASPGVLSDIVNRLPDVSGRELADLYFMHDKFVVPDAFRKPTEMLWRVAYRARGADLTADPEVAAASDALDVLISIFLRRGVTNLAIADAAGVTHRAVLDRMRRARARGLLLECRDDLCEGFIGEEQIIKAFNEGLDAISSEELSRWSMTSYADDREANPYLAMVRATSPTPSSFWLQTLMDNRTDYLAVTPLEGDEATEMKSRLSIARLPWTDVPAEEYNEIMFSALLGRMSERSETRTVADYGRSQRLLFVPANLLYTEQTEKLGLTPQDAAEALAAIPSTLRAEHFSADLVRQCFEDPDAIAAEYEPTTKHAADAKTRAGVSA